MVSMAESYAKGLRRKASYTEGITSDEYQYDADHFDKLATALTEILNGGQDEQR